MIDAKASQCSGAVKGGVISSEMEMKMKRYRSELADRKQ
jgi:hypothetical protein